METNTYQSKPKTSNQGISIDLLTFTDWTQAIYTDACEHGIGGFNPQTGKAWRLELPHWAKNFRINALEFLASFIGLWFETIENKQPYARFLCMTDCSSSLAWLFKVNFDSPTQKLKNSIARKLARTTMDAEVALYSQHIPGCHNVVADCLSRDHHIDNKKLTFLLQQLYPSQTQGNFFILEKLPKEIASWIEFLSHDEIKSRHYLPVPIAAKWGL